MEKDNYSFMNLVWIIFLVSSCGILKPNLHEEYIEHYQVSSPILTELVEATIDSCQSRIRCDIVEYLFVQMETTSKYSIQVESLRKPLYKLSSIFQKDSSQAVSFYIGETLCFADKEVLFSSGLLNDFKKIGRTDLSNQSFEYNCLDIEANGEIYNILINFSYSIENGEVVLENNSIFIDSGDADISEALKKRGITSQ